MNLAIPLKNYPCRPQGNFFYMLSICDFIHLKINCVNGGFRLGLLASAMRNQIIILRQSYG